MAFGRMPQGQGLCKFAGEGRPLLISFGYPPPPDRASLALCHRDGTPIQTMKRSFQSLLDYAGVPVDRDGPARTIYSLRHFCATQRLSHETSPFLLAKQMGTSVEMLEKFYGQTVTSALAAQTPMPNRTKETGRRDGAYPF